MKMPKFSRQSLEALGTCDSRLQDILKEVIKVFDFTVVEGFRTKERQDFAVANGKSKTPWPTSKHNHVPSKAVDITPYPIDWSDIESAHLRYAYLAGFVMSEAIRQGVKLRWGGDWNRNKDTRDETFLDLPHFELDEP